MLVQIERVDGRDQTMLFRSPRVALPGEPAKAFGLGFNPIRAIEPNQRILRQIRKRRHQRRSKIGRQEFDSRERNARTRGFEKTIFFYAIHFQLQRALIQPTQRDLQPTLLEGELLHRQQQHLFLYLRAALRRRVELANGFQPVAVEFEAQRPAVARGIQIDDAAAHAEIAALLDQRNILKTPLHQMLEQ